MPKSPESEILTNLWPKVFADIHPFNLQKSGFKRFHGKSSTDSPSHEKFSHHKTVEAGRHNAHQQKLLGNDLPGDYGKFAQTNSQECLSHQMPCCVHFCVLALVCQLTLSLQERFACEETMTARMNRAAEQGSLSCGKSMQILVH